MRRARLTRQLTRLLARHPVHRDDKEGMHEHLTRRIPSPQTNGQAIWHSTPTCITRHPGLVEEFEAMVTCALIQSSRSSPDELGVEPHTNGLAEVVGELRRRCLDILRHGYSVEAERLLTAMDDIYAVLVTMDYPDAITNGLRRQTDIARSIIEKTRGDITFSLRGEHLERAIAHLSNQLGADQPDNVHLTRHDED
jgi:translin